MSNAFTFLEASVIPKEKLERFSSLRPTRKMIILSYLMERQSNLHNSQQALLNIAKQLGYSINENGTNTFLYKVIHEFFA